MKNQINQFRNAVNSSALAKDERGLSTVEYVIILVLIAAAAVGTWSTFGGTVKGKIDASTSQVGSVSTANPSIQ